MKTNAKNCIAKATIEPTKDAKKVFKVCPWED